MNAGPETSGRTVGERWNVGAPPFKDSVFSRGRQDEKFFPNVFAASPGRNKGKKNAEGNGEKRTSRETGKKNVEGNGEKERGGKRGKMNVEGNGEKERGGKREIKDAETRKDEAPLDAFRHKTAETVERRFKRRR